MGAIISIAGLYLTYRTGRFLLTDVIGVKVARKLFIWSVGGFTIACIYAGINPLDIFARLVEWTNDD